MSTCSLCDLPTPEQPVTDDGVPGSYCCRGCLEVAGTLDSVDDVEAESVRERTREESAAEAPDDAAEAFLHIDGLHCTSCEAFVSLLGERNDGIHDVSVSYATDTARVAYDDDRLAEDDLPELLSGHGYTASMDEHDGRHADEATLQRLLVGGFFTMLIMPWYLFYLYPSYVGIETGILTVDATSGFGVYFPLAMLGVFTTIVLLYTGKPVLRGAYVALRTGRPNMDLLVAVAAVAAYAYSTLALATGSTHLYYDVTVAVVMVVTLGNYYEGKIKDRATGLLSEFATARVEEATRRIPSGTETVSVNELIAGDEVLVKPGERVPVDGTVIEGVAAVDESLLTGESLPERRGPGDEVHGGTVVTDSPLVIEVGLDATSTLDRIATLLWSIQASRPGIQRFVDRLATVFVPFVFALAATVVVWRLLEGRNPHAALLTGLTVLVVSCPCAMGLATPLAVAGGLRDALERGIVVTNETLFEAAPDAETVVFDKTGTLTAGEMTVRAVHGEFDALRTAAAVERRSEHPAAAAIVETVEERLGGNHRPLTDGAGVLESTPKEAGGPADSVVGFERHPGDGVEGVVDGERVVVGTPELVERECGAFPEPLAGAVEAAHGNGRLPVVVGVDGEARTVAVLGDRRREWERAVEAVADREVLVLTGDSEEAAAPFREHPAVDGVFADVPPDGKVETVRRLRAEGTVAMVGDGTNDAPALAEADLGIAMGSGTASAADAADAIVATDDLGAVEAVFDLADGTRRRVRENVCWALLYNAIALPLAAAGLINPLFAALAMAASSLIVVTNSTRPVL